MKRILLSCLLSVLCLCAGARDYSVLKFGAVSDTSKLSTRSIQRAIDRCAAKGGGRVVFPAGSYKTGTLILRSNVELHLESGATLYGSTRLEDYRPMRTSYVSLRTQGETVQLIYADSVEHVSITGRGTIDGRGRGFPKLSADDAGITRPHLLRFIQCRDVTVRGVTLRNSGCWMQHYLACDLVRVEDVTVYNRNHYNNDAIDIDGCRDVIVRGMIADTDDDGITLKSTSPRPCENVLVADCVVSSHCNALKLGTESNGGFRNISISDVIVRPSADQRELFFGRREGLSAISLEIVDGGTMENVSVSDITVEGTASPIFIRLGNRARGYYEGQVIEHVGTIRGVSLDNIRIRHAGSFGCSITGLAGHPVEDVRLSRIHILHQGGVTEEALPAIREALKDEKEKGYPECVMWGRLPARGFFLRHTRGVTFEDVTIETEAPDARPDFVSED